MGKTSHVHGPSSLKWQCLLKLLTRLNRTPIKIPADFFVEIEKLIPKIHMEIQGTQNSK